MKNNDNTYNVFAEYAKKAMEENFGEDFADIIGFFQR